MVAPPASAPLPANLSAEAAAAAAAAAMSSMVLTHSAAFWICSSMSPKVSAAVLHVQRHSLQTWVTSALTRSE